MGKRRKRLRGVPACSSLSLYDQVLGHVAALLESARRAAAKSINSVMTATYWDVGRRLVEFEQGGQGTAEYGTALLKKLASDLTNRFGRGFSWRNLYQMRGFYLAYREILQTASAKFDDPILQTASAKLGDADHPRSKSANALSISTSREVDLSDVAACLPLPWSHYVLLLKVDKPEARVFYESEALRNGWTVRQLERQIATLFYERTLASRGKNAMVKKGAIAKRGEILTAEQEIKDPFVLEFLGLKDEYSESDLEEALIQELETFLLELGGDFAFVGRQKRLRIGDEWYRIDLLFFHRKLRCLVVIDLKLGKFTHADAGQMHLYLNYARKHWMHEGENPPVGVILCTQKDTAVAHYALDNLPNKVLAAEYRTALPAEKTLAKELSVKRKLLESRSKSRRGSKRP